MKPEMIPKTNLFLRGNQTIHAKCPVWDPNHSPCHAFILPQSPTACQWSFEVATFFGLIDDVSAGKLMRSHCFCHVRMLAWPHQHHDSRDTSNAHNGSSTSLSQKIQAVISGVTDGVRTTFSGKLNLKTGPPLSFYLSFNIRLIFGRLFFAIFGVFSGDFVF